MAEKLERPKNLDAFAEIEDGMPLPCPVLEACSRAVSFARYAQQLEAERSKWEGVVYMLEARSEKVIADHARARTGQMCDICEAEWPCQTVSILRGEGE